MDQAILVSDQINEGRRLLDRLAEDGTDILAACWLLMMDDSWSFALVTDEVEKRGKSATYRRVFFVLQLISEGFIEINSLKIVGAKDKLAKPICDIADHMAKTGSLPGYTFSSKLHIVGAVKAYLFSRPERGFEGYSKIKAQFPWAEILNLHVKLDKPYNVAWYFPVVGPYVGKVNSSTFKGKPPETLLCIGPTAKSTEDAGLITFVFRPEGWNKIFRTATKTWEEVRLLATDSKPYEVADFTPIMDLVVPEEQEVSLPPALRL